MFASGNSKLKFTDKIFETPPLPLAQYLASFLVGTFCYAHLLVMLVIQISLKMICNNKRHLFSKKYYF